MIHLIQARVPSVVAEAPLLHHRTKVYPQVEVEQFLLFLIVEAWLLGLPMDLWYLADQGGMILVDLTCFCKSPLVPHLLRGHVLISNLIFLDFVLKRRAASYH